MKLNSSLVSCVLTSILIGTSAYAETTYDAKTVISQDQLSTIVSTILKIAPSGTKAQDVKLNGFFTLNNDRFLTLLDVSSINFKVITKVAGIPLTSQVSMTLAAQIPDLNCNNVQVTRADSTGTNILLDGSVKDHIKKNAASIIRDNFIAQSDLFKFCKVKPVKPFMSYDLPFEFELVPMDDDIA